MIRRMGFVTVVALALACSSSTTQFVSSWKAPDAEPLAFRDSKVVAVVMATNPTLRREAEDTLAREITERGAQGVAMYRILEEANSGNEDEARRALEAAQIKGVIVMRPVATEKEVVSVPAASRGTAGTEYYYPTYYGGYYSYGWGDPYESQLRTDTIVSVETLVYSLEQNKLVWSGRSKTTNPEKVDEFVKEVADAVADELKKEKLISG
jgi:hypothetical protein